MLRNDILYNSSECNTARKNVPKSHDYEQQCVRTKKCVCICTQNTQRCLVVRVGIAAMFLAVVYDVHTTTASDVCVFVFEECLSV